jgi:hypothetical protein
VSDDADLNGIHELFWAVRRDPALAAELRADPGRVLPRYDIAGEFAVAVAALDVVGLYRFGVNPYLLFFASVELGMPRDEYYRRMAAEEGAPAP